jgi:hypothetical protein
MENSDLNSIGEPFDNPKNYSIFFSSAFKDLIDLAGEDYDAFIELFYNRNQEYVEFNTIASNLVATGDNVLVIGDAGTGKSNFIYRLFYEETMLKKYNLYPIMIDFRKIAIEDKLVGFKLMFVEKMFSYFENINYDIYPVDGKIKVENINDNLHLIQSKLTQLVKDRKKNETAFGFR